MSNCCTICATDIISCMLTGNLRVYVTGLDHASNYWWVITDAHGNKYQDEFQYDAGQGYFEIDVTTQLPAGILNQHAGKFKLHIQTVATSTGSVPVGFKKSVDCIEFEVTCGDFYEKEQIGIE